jgi:nicotinate-nucleotide adenylyltransferase
MPSPQGARRIGLFGGSFDPVHNAHLALAQSALGALALDELRWVPASAPWQKAGMVATSAQRAEMVRLAIAGEARFRIEPCEIERGGASYTIDTVLELQSREPETHWLLLLGQDQLARLHTWHRWRELVGLVDLAVANRDGEVPCVPPELGDARVSLTQVPLPAMAVSSTEIRSRVDAGHSIASLVPPAVARYIGEHGLYRHPLRS